MTDRRYVLAALAAIGAIAGLLIFLVEPSNVTLLLTLIAIYGAMANALYPIAVSHANDFAQPEDFVKVSGGLLLLYGIGTIIGPTIGGPVMTAAGPYGLFMITAAAHLVVAAYAIFRSRRRAPRPAAERDAYSAVNPGMLTTPESLQLSPKAAPFTPEHDQAAMGETSQPAPDAPRETVPDELPVHVSTDAPDAPATGPSGEKP